MINFRKFGRKNKYNKVQNYKKENLIINQKNKNNHKQDYLFRNY